MENFLIIQKQFEKIEALKVKIARLDKGYSISFCHKQKQRIAWDHYKAQLELRRETKQYVNLCDVMVSSTEIENFLLNQNITIAK